MSRAECEAANTSTLKQISRSIGTAHGVDSGGGRYRKVENTNLVDNKRRVDLRLRYDFSGGSVCCVGGHHSIGLDMDESYMID